MKAMVHPSYVENKLPEQIQKDQEIINLPQPNLIVSTMPSYIKKVAIVGVSLSHSRHISLTQTSDNDDRQQET